MTTSTPLLYPRLRKVLILLPLALLVFSLLYTHLTPYGSAYIPPIKGVDITGLCGTQTRTANSLVPEYRSVWRMYQSSSYRAFLAAYETEKKAEIADPEARKPNSFLFENILTSVMEDNPKPGAYPELWAKMLAKYPKSVAVLRELSNSPELSDDVRYAIGWMQPRVLLKMESLRAMAEGDSSEAARLLALMARVFGVQDRGRAGHIANVFALLSSWGDFTREDLGTIRQALGKGRSKQDYMRMGAQEYLRCLAGIVQEPVDGQRFTSHGDDIYWNIGRRNVNRYDESPMWDLQWFLIGIAGYRGFGLSLQQVLTLNAVTTLEQSDKKNAWSRERNPVIMGRWNRKRLDLLADHFARGYGSYWWISRYPIQTMATEQTQIRLLGLLLDIEEYRLANGAPPSHLDQLPPPRDPSDRMDPFTGLSFIYKATSDQYQVYSLGPDGYDHGGYDDRRPGGGSRDLSARVLL